MALKYSFNQAKVDDYDFVAEGDDSLSGANNIDLDVFLGSFKKLGLNVTADVTHGLAGATFC